MRTKFLLSIGFALLWLAVSIYIAQPWISELSDLTNIFIAWAVVSGIALIPGYLNAHLLSSLLLSPKPYQWSYSAGAWMIQKQATIIIATYNEEDNIQACLEALTRKAIRPRIIVSDDGSTDQTVRIAESLLDLESGYDKVITTDHNTGKSGALNRGLDEVNTPYIITVDADTIVEKFALQNLLHHLSYNKHGAVAGSVLASNYDASVTTRMQDFDYHLGIASIKRQQAAYDGTLVAQGAFSAYLTDAVVDAGGWDETAIGEDIILTWGILRNGHTTSWAGDAIAYTVVPDDIPSFIRQRRRWARGMIEGLRRYGWDLIKQHKMHSHAVATNVVFPFVDAIYCFAFIPGLALALLGISTALVSVMTLLVLPLNLVLGTVMAYKQRPYNDRSDRVNKRGYGLYVLLYQFISAPVSLLGYGSELFGIKKSW